MFTYNTTKVQDNFWLTAGESQPLYWILEGDDWDAATLALLDHCLARMTYFGRAESITLMERIAELPESPNCILSAKQSAQSVPVLCPRAEVTLEQIHLTTDDPAVRNSTVPPGAIWKFAQRPPRPAIRTRPKPMKQNRPTTHFLQAAIGSRVAPSLDHVALLANWFRGRAIRIFLENCFGLERGDWKLASDSQREAVALLSGKLANGDPMTGHHHTYYGLYLDPENGRPSRLMAWRQTPFSDQEQQALLEAASEPFSLGYKQTRNAAKDPWQVHCVPMDSGVPPPPGFPIASEHRVWRTMTPYVPPRHAFDRRGNPKKNESPMEQLQRELEQRGFPSATVLSLNSQSQIVSPDALPEAEWVKVHGPSEHSSASNQSKRGYRFQLAFQDPVAGPIALGRSSHFGLGLFVPVES
jgi:CRISPR-associated protein Csb2